MSRIKYLVHAVLLLVGLSLAVFIVAKLSLVEFVAQKPIVFDYVDKPAVATVSINAEGKKLFEDNCHTCHSLHQTDNFNFESIETRGPWVDRKNLIAWIKNSAMMISKFQYTKDLVEQFNGQMMPSFSHLTNAQIEAILVPHQKLFAPGDKRNRDDEIVSLSFFSCRKKAILYLHKPFEKEPVYGACVDRLKRTSKTFHPAVSGMECLCKCRIGLQSVQECDGACSATGCNES